MWHESYSIKFPAFRRSVLDWYAGNARDLPWRREVSLYRTVVSEFMAQQTRIDTMLPYFARWMETFPDFEALARAKEERVLKHWEGLGYYNRARNLHKLARYLIDHYNLEAKAAGTEALFAAEPGARPPLPTDAKSWEGFPGIGPYTAAAITSISFGTPAAAVDGNVIRILTRVTGDGRTFRDGPAAAKALRPLAEELVDPGDPGNFNQGIMELGATVCHRRKPLCTICPLLTHCTAGQRGDPEEYPCIQRKNTVDRTVDRALVIDGSRILLYQAEARGRLKGIHELPELGSLNLKTNGAAPIANKKRGIGQERITERIHYFATDSSGEIETARHQEWVPLADLDALTLSGPHKRWLAELLPKLIDQPATAATKSSRK